MPTVKTRNVHMSGRRIRKKWASSYTRTASTPVGPMQTLMAVPGGIMAGADAVVTIPVLTRRRPAHKLAPSRDGLSHSR